MEPAKPTTATATSSAEPRPFDRRAFFLALFVSLLWGAGYPISQGAMAFCTPCKFAALRFLLAALVLSPLLPSLPQKLRQLTQKEKLALAFITLLFALNFAFTLWGVYVEGANQTAVLMNLIVLWTVIFAHWLLPDDKIDGRKVAGLLCGLVGAVVVTSGQGALGRWSLGNVFPLVATFCISLQNVLIRKYLTRVDPFTILHVEILVAAPLLGLVSTIFESGSVSWTPPFIFGLVYTGIMTTCLAFYMWYHLLTTYPVSTVAIMTFSIPVFAMVASYVANSTVPTWEQMVGAALIAAAIFATNRGK